jgi:hypothetical protein
MVLKWLAVRLGPLPGGTPGLGEAPEARLPGASFVNYGHAFSSMIMAGLWALALACYLAGAILAVQGRG